MAFVKIPWRAPQRGRQMGFRAAETQTEGAPWTLTRNHIPNMMWGCTWRRQCCQMGALFSRSRGKSSVCRWPGIQLLLTTLWVVSPVIFLPRGVVLILYPLQALHSIIVMSLSPANPHANPHLSSIISALLIPSTLSVPPSGHPVLLELPGHTALHIMEGHIPNLGKNLVPNLPHLPCTHHPFLPFSVSADDLGSSLTSLPKWGHDDDILIPRPWLSGPSSSACLSICSQRKKTTLCFPLKYCFLSLWVPSFLTSSRTSLHFFCILNFSFFNWKSPRASKSANLLNNNFLSQLSNNHYLSSCLHQYIHKRTCLLPASRALLLHWSTSQPLSPSQSDSISLSLSIQSTQ